MIEAKVLCNKKEEKIIEITKDKFLIHLKSKPVDNKANKELINLLSNFLDVNKNQIMIKSGLKARTKIIDKFKPQNTIFYPGCLTKYKGKKWQENYENILRHIGIDFIVLDDLKCCGSPVLNAGNFTLYKKLLKENFDILKASSVTRIITGCPACFKNFKKEYKQILGDDWKIEVYHASTIIYDALKAGKIKFKKLNISVTYHDPCHLGRHMGVYDQPREIIRAITDDFREMELTREYSFCCGGGGGVASTLPQKAKKIAEERIEQAKETKASYIITPCPMCDMHLDQSSNKQIKVMELSELVIKAITN